MNPIDRPLSILAHWRISDRLFQLFNPMAPTAVHRADPRSFSACGEFSRIIATTTLPPMVHSKVGCQLVMNSDGVSSSIASQSRFSRTPNEYPLKPFGHTFALASTLVLLENQHVDLRRKRSARAPANVAIALVGSPGEIPLAPTPGLVDIEE